MEVFLVISGPNSPSEIVERVIDTDTRKGIGIDWYKVECKLQREVMSFIAAQQMERAIDLNMQ